MGYLFNGTGLLVFFAALLLSFLLYLKAKKPKAVAIANMCSLLVFLVSLFFAIHVLTAGMNDLEETGWMLGALILMNLYAGAYNVAARIWVRVMEIMGNKRLKFKIQAEIVER